MATDPVEILNRRNAVVAKICNFADLSSRPQENRAWESYTLPYQDVSETRGVGHLLERDLTEPAFSSEAAG